jgi:hypothetical protein
VDWLCATEPEFLGSLVYSLLRQSHKLLDIADWALNIHCWNIESERRKLDCNHILRRRYILSELLDIKWTTEHPEHMTMRCRSNVLVLEETTIEISH